MRRGQFYDLTVPGFGHYSAQGLWHHNSGKTVALCLHAIRNAVNDPNGMSLIGRLNVPALTKSTMRTFLELVPEEWGEWRASDAPKRFIFANGHEVVFWHLDVSDPAVAGHIKSMNLSAAFIDEATEISEKIYLLVDSRVRRKTATRHLVRLASNPGGHDWVWRHYFNPDRRGALHYNVGINASMFDNTHLPPEYVEHARATWPSDWAERYIYGHFSDFSDLVYKEFTEQTHVWSSVNPSGTPRCHDFFGGLPHPPKDWPVIIGIDIGGGDAEHDPWAIPLIAVAPDGRLFQFDEIYGSGLLIAPIAEELHAMLEGRPEPDVAYDYAQRQCGVELAEHGISGGPAIKDVVPGLQKCEQYMHIDPRLTHPFNPKLEGSPRYFVASHCTNTIEELTSYKWGKDRSGNPTGKPAHENSHCPDAIRYAIHTFRPDPEKPHEPAKWEREGLNPISRMYWQEAERHPARSGRDKLPEEPPRYAKPRTIREWQAWVAARAKTGRFRRPSGLRYTRPTL